MTIIGQEWLKQVEDILEVLSEGVGITDDTGHVLFANECIERLLDAPRAALIGKTADAFYSGEDYEFTLARRAPNNGYWLRPIRLLCSPPYSAGPLHDDVTLILAEIR